jgi:peptide methionine sulfoxide reductase msrA/msrB
MTTNPTPNPNKKFTDLENSIMFHKATERAGTGEFDHFFEDGIYTCKNCGTALYSSAFKFDSGCGWPSFDDEIKGSIKKETDSDGRRTEILCNNCGIHLGHVFSGEGATLKNLRHCVNSSSMEFVDENEMNSSSRFQIAILAAGCFWGVEHYLAKLLGVLTSEVGYTGGHADFPTYKEVCKGNTGHLEAIKVIFDSTVIQYEDIIKYFFEIHDFEQTDGQGNDRGEQYLSAIFVQDQTQRDQVQNVINTLTEKGYKVATTIREFAKFYIAEDYHQEYYTKSGGTPYCHFHKKIFEIDK